MLSITCNKITYINLIIIIFSLFSSLSYTIAQNYGQWISVAPMNLDRSDFASIVLPNGNVLVTGGQSYSKDTITNTCEEYNYKKNTWNYIANMNIPRTNHKLVLLDSNRVIAIGGYKLKSCEIYNIIENKWSLTDSLKISRYFGYTANKLNNGQIIVTGGISLSKDMKTFQYLKDTEIYNPLLNKWFEIDSLKIGRANHSTVVLNDGRLLVIGGEIKNGQEKDCEIFDPSSGKWNIVDSLNIARYNQSTLLLSNGNVFVSGGSNYKNPSGQWLNSCEIYVTKTNTWKLITPLVYNRDAHSSILLNNGLVLLTGGDIGNDTWELYNPVSFQNIYSAKFPYVQSLQQICRLTNGEVISIGGTTWRDSALPVISTTAMCEIYSTIDGVNIVPKDKIPKECELFQNYPNPFNPTTNIKYNINKPGFVKILVYNIEGKKVKDLVNKYQNIGSYNIEFNGLKLSSGIYFYTMKFNNINITKKMILLQ